MRDLKAWIGEYTITLVDQATSGGQNITQTASGTGVTQIGNLEEGKTYVVTLSRHIDSYGRSV